MSTARTTFAPTHRAAPEAMSAYLALRHLPRADLAWRPGVVPALPTSSHAPTPVGSTAELLDGLRAAVPEHAGLGLLLSGGIDSAVLAALVAPGTPCFTIAFDVPDAIDESSAAAAYAARWGHPHRVVRVRWQDYLDEADALMAVKRSPLHAIEVPLHLAARTARSVGVETLLVGNGADSNFGGLDKLLAVDWTFDDFVRRYCFADPTKILTDPRDVTAYFAPYRTPSGIDVQAFLHEVHGQGIVQSFETAIGAAGVEIVAPYETVCHRGPLDLARIRAGEPKYLVQAAFRELYGAEHVPAKIAFARPTDVWLAGWAGPSARADLRHDLDLRGAGGEERWLVWCLDRFLDLLERGDVG
jgi:hypothetical protein